MVVGLAVEKEEEDEETLGGMTLHDPNATRQEKEGTRER